MMKPLLILALSIIASSLSLAQSKRELVKKVLSSAKDYRGMAPILDIVQSMPEESSHLPLLDPLGEQSYRISSSFGKRQDPITKQAKTHHGIDLASNYACKVYSTASGSVIFSGNKGGYGKCIIIKHRYGFLTYYAHMTYLYVSTGAKVKAGDVIGFVGSTGRSTGNHLHYEVRKHDSPINPLEWLPQSRSKQR